MKQSEAIINYTNRREHHSRELGRYWASEIYGIRKGYKQPEDHFKEQDIDAQGCWRIELGNKAEELLKEVYEHNGKKVGDQKKYEIYIDDGRPVNVINVPDINPEITLVIKPDFEFEDRVEECKFSLAQPQDIPEKWKDQLECEYRATAKPVYLVMLHNAPPTKHLYKPSELRWKSIQKAIINYHKEVKEYGKHLPSMQSAKKGDTSRSI